MIRIIMSLIKFGKAGCLKPLNIRAMIHYYIDFQIVAIILVHHS